MEVLLRHIVVIWDECEHVSSRRLDVLSKAFMQGYGAAFPESGGSAVSPILIATNSPILKRENISAFLHEGKFVPHLGDNQDLALVKFCSTGLMDQDETYHFILDELRQKQHRNGDYMIGSAESTATIFVTSDSARGMNAAIESVQRRKKGLRTTFISLRIPKLAGKNDVRMNKVGEILGFEMRKRFIRHEHGCLLIKVEN